MKHMRYIYFSVLLLVVMAGCTKSDQSNIVIPAAEVHFLSATKNVGYPVRNAPLDSFVVQVGTTNVSNVDRTVSFNITSPTGAVKGTDYNVVSPSTGNTVVIPAGKAVGSIKIHGIFSAYAAGKRDTLVFTLAQPSLPVSKFSDTVNLILQRFCDIVPADFSGNFKVLLDEWADYSVGDIIPLTVSGDTVMFRYFASAAVPIKILVNKTTGVTSVAKQVYGRYGPTEVFSCASVAGSAFNTVNACDKIIGVNLNHTSPLGNYGNYAIRLQKQ